VRPVSVLGGENQGQLQKAAGWPRQKVSGEKKGGEEEICLLFSPWRAVSGSPGTVPSLTLIELSQWGTVSWEGNLESSNT